MDNRLIEAANLFKSGNKTDAFDLFKRIVDDEPSNPHAWFGMAVCSESTDKKISCLNKVLEIDPNYEKAKTLLEKLKMEEEEKFFQKLNLEPQPDVQQNPQSIMYQIDDTQGNAKPNEKGDFIQIRYIIPIFSLISILGVVATWGLESKCDVLLSRYSGLTFPLGKVTIIIAIGIFFISLLVRTTPGQSASELAAWFAVINLITVGGWNLMNYTNIQKNLLLCRALSPEGYCDCPSMMVVGGYGLILTYFALVLIIIFGAVRNPKPK